jgi:hypothetical protein
MTINLGGAAVQTCSRCNFQSQDNVGICPNCQADLKLYSNTAVALKNLRANARVTAIRISLPDDACPTCQAVMGTYAKDAVPLLPVEGCSEINGCCCFYEPVLDQIYP